MKLAWTRFHTPSLKKIKKERKERGKKKTNLGLATLALVLVLLVSVGFSPEEADFWMSSAARKAGSSGGGASGGGWVKLAYNQWRSNDWWHLLWRRSKGERRRKETHLRLRRMRLVVHGGGRRRGIIVGRFEKRFEGNDLLDRLRFVPWRPAHPCTNTCLLRFINYLFLY